MYLWVAHFHLGLCDKLQLVVVQADVDPCVHNKTLECPLWLLQHKNTTLDLMAGMWA